MTPQRKAELDKQGRLFNHWLRMVTEAILVNQAALRAATGPLTAAEKQYLAKQMLLNLETLSPAERGELLDHLPDLNTPRHFALLTLLQGVLGD